MTHDELQTQLDRLAAVLREERGAVATLDVEAMVRLGEEKSALVEALTAAVSARPGEGRAELRDRVTRVAIEAEANAFVVRDALAYIRGLLGAPEPGGTYDAHGAPAGRGAHRLARSV